MDDQQADESQVDLLIRATEDLPTLIALVAAPSLSLRYANRACRRFAQDENPAGRPLADILPMIDTAAAAECIRTGRPVTRSAVVHAETTWWDIAIVKLANAPHTLAVTAHDVSAHICPRQPATQRDGCAVPRSEQRLRASLQQIPAAVFIVEAPDGGIALRSDRLVQMLGHPPHHLGAAHHVSHGRAEHADGRPYAAQEYPSHRALRNGETVEAEPMIYRRGDGLRIDLEMYAGPVRDDSGTVVAAVAAALDVTDRCQAEATLRESEARVRLAVEAAGLGTWEVDLAANTVRYGPECAAMFGLPARSMLRPRDSFPKFIHPDDEARANAEFAAAIAAGGPYQSEFRGRTAQGENRWFVCHGRILRHPDGTPSRAVGVLRDVTQRHLREESLRAAVQARELLVREADHRIKNSLQLVGSLLGLQRARMTDPDAMAAMDEAMVRVIAVSEAHRALQQSEDLRQINFDQMLHDLCTHVGALNPQVRFNCACAAPLPLDTERAIPLGLIVSELLTNAAKHAYAGGSGAVHAAAHTADGWVEVTVADDGVGLPDDAPGSGPAGSEMAGGFGTTIIRALARKIGADVTTASERGQGTRTTLRFPRTP